VRHDLKASPALIIIGKGRKIGVLVTDQVDFRMLAALRRGGEGASGPTAKGTEEKGRMQWYAYSDSIYGLGIETAVIVHEVFSRDLRDRRAVPRYAGLTGSLDESGERLRKKGLARAGNARVRRGMIQLAWRFLQFQGRP
jgi:hypothetical protein